MRKCTFLVLLFLFSKAVQSQETTSQIVGMVKNENQPIAGATVTAVHQPTGTGYTTSSRQDGRYTLANLKVGGLYTISTTFVGFKADPMENVTLILGQEFTADFDMKVESKSMETVVITTTSRQDKTFNSGRTGSQEIISRT